MKKIIIPFLITLTFIACNSLEKKLEGGWVIDQAYYNNEPVIWDLYSNSLDLNKNNACDLPPIKSLSERSSEEENGKWKAYIKNNKSYLQINTTNRIFNRTFEILTLKKVQDTISWGYLMKMTLEADSLKLDCTKALYE